jgi:hypothetical protein
VPHRPHGQPEFIHQFANRLAHILERLMADIGAWNDRSSARVQRRHDRLSQAAKTLAHKIGRKS